MLRRLLPVFFLGYLAIPASLPAQENEHPLVTMGLIHEVKLSQTIDDVTVTLDWVYADTLGFVLQTTLAGLPPEVKLAFEAVSDQLRAVAKRRIP